MFGKNTTLYKKDKEATFQNLKLTLTSEMGELKDDPYFGVNLRKYLFEQNSTILEDVLIDEIYNRIASFIPQLKVERKNITITKDHYKVFINIKATNLINFENDLYNIVLLQEDND